MIRRTQAAVFLNGVANHPDVRPYLGHPDSPEPLDLSPLVENPANIALEADGGGWLLHALLPGVYELHTFFLPEARGKPYFRQAREALRLVFTTTDALEILTRCPDDNPGARMAAALTGFRERGRREGTWNVGTPSECGVSHQAFTLDDWQARDHVIAGVGSEALEAIGDARARLAPDEPIPPLDDWLARLVGAAVLMVRGGHAAKAVGVFNRTAAFAGFPTIVALRDDVLDIAGAIVHVKPDGFGVLLTG